MRCLSVLFLVHSRHFQRSGEISAVLCCFIRTRYLCGKHRINSQHFAFSDIAEFIIALISVPVIPALIVFARFVFVSVLYSWYVESSYMTNTISKVWPKCRSFAHTIQLVHTISTVTQSVYIVMLCITSFTLFISIHGFCHGRFLTLTTFSVVHCFYQCLYVVKNTTN